MDVSSSDFNTLMDPSSSGVTSLINVSSTQWSIGMSGNNVEISVVLTTDNMCLTVSIISICASECEKNAVIISSKYIIDAAGDGEVLSSTWCLPCASWSGMVTPSTPPNSTIKSASGAGCPQTNCIVRPSAMLPARSTPLRKLRCASPDLSTERLCVLKSEITSAKRNMALVGKTTSRITSHKAWGKEKCMLSWIHTLIDLYMHYIANAFPHIQWSWSRPWCWWFCSSMCFPASIEEVTYIWTWHMASWPMTQMIHNLMITLASRVHKNCYSEYAMFYCISNFYLMLWRHKPD